MKFSKSEKLPVVEVSKTDLGVQIRFKSPGDPIADEDRPRLGAKGFKIPPLNRYGFKQVTGGTGFGLYFCKLVARAHGGNMDAVRFENGYNVFSFTLAATCSR